jgi:hypothetical protein
MTYAILVQFRIFDICPVWVPGIILMQNNIRAFSIKVSHTKINNYQNLFGYFAFLKERCYIRMFRPAHGETST